MFTRSDSEALTRHTTRARAPFNTPDAILYDVVETTMLHLDARLTELSLKNFGNDPMAHVEAAVVEFVERVFKDNPNPHRLTAIQRIEAEIAAGRGEEPLDALDDPPAIGPHYARHARFAR